jgi:peptidyl-prolyl cis-trans isomerase A (cyclophilin A)
MKRWTLVLVALVGACRTEPPPEPSSASTATATVPPAATAAAQPAPAATQANTDIQLAANKATGDDPLSGKFSLADATKDIKGSGALIGTIDTNKGKVSCKLYEDKAPVTVANFVGLATGKRTWKDPNSGQWVNKPAYDGTTFHRIIKGFMIQGGDAKGNGTGEPGYTIPDEMWDGAKHDRAGLLCMANRGPNTNGAQFFITESDGPSVANLDRYHTYTIFGECTPVDTIHTIAAVQTGPMDRPKDPVTINSVKIAREKPAK